MDDSIDHSACESCPLLASKPQTYCASYCGSGYGMLRPRLLFIGLDNGIPGDQTDTCEGRRREVLNYRNPPYARWNPHYKGCIWLASRLLNMPCSSDCADQCKRKPESNCALMYFRQANAVRCVEVGK